MIRRFPRTRLLVSLLAALLCGCDKTPTSSLPVTHMRLGSKDFTLEIATTPEQQAIGLMHRDSMAQDHGMIFVFPDEIQRAFWNEHVHFSLDLIFLDSNGTIVSIKQLQAWSTDNVPSDAAARYAIELNAGVAQSVGLAVGTRLSIPSDILGPAPTGR
jgi:uncharacterized membrane protein (UPF0127 family)